MKSTLLSATTSTHVKRIAMGVFLSVAVMSGPADVAAAAIVDLGTAGNFAILSEAGISTTTGTSIVGDIGVSPIASTAITGFDLTLDSSGQFSTSSLVTGKVFAPNYAVPTPAMLSTAIGDMATA